jgi:hypothetical protein
VPLNVCTIVYTVWRGAAVAGRVPIRFGLVPEVVVCETAPCRWMTPELSLYQAGGPAARKGGPVGGIERDRRARVRRAVGDAFQGEEADVLDGRGAWRGKEDVTR